MAILRVEQLYPFPKAQVEAAIASFSKLKTVVWSQEEPRNMGAWTFVMKMSLGEVEPNTTVAKS